MPISAIVRSASGPPSPAGEEGAVSMVGRRGGAWCATPTALVYRDASGAVTFTHTLRQGQATSLVVAENKGGNETVWAGFTTGLIAVFPAADDVLTADTPLRCLTHHTAAVNHLAWSEDDTPCVLSASDDCSVCQWDVERLTLIRIIGVHSAAVLTLETWGNTLLSGGRDKTVRVWEMSTGDTITTLPSHTAEVTALAADPERTQHGACGTLWVGAADGAIHVWNLAKARLKVKAGTTGEAICKVAVCCSDVLSIDAACNVLLWCPSSLCIVKKIPITGHIGPLTAVRVQRADTSCLTFWLSGPRCALKPWTYMLEEKEHIPSPCPAKAPPPLSPSTRANPHSSPVVLSRAPSSILHIEASRGYCPIAEAHSAPCCPSPATPTAARDYSSPVLVSTSMCDSITSESYSDAQSDQLTARGNHSTPFHSSSHPPSAYLTQPLHPASPPVTTPGDSEYLPSSTGCNSPPPPNVSSSSLLDDTYYFHPITSDDNDPGPRCPPPSSVSESRPASPTISSALSQLPKLSFEITSFEPGEPSHSLPKAAAPRDAPDTHSGDPQCRAEPPHETSPMLHQPCAAHPLQAPNSVEQKETAAVDDAQSDRDVVELRLRLSKTNQKLLAETQRARQAESDLVAVKEELAALKKCVAEQETDRESKDKAKVVALEQQVVALKAELLKVKEEDMTFRRESAEVLEKAVATAEQLHAAQELAEKAEAAADQARKEAEEAVANAASQETAARRLRDELATCQQDRSEARSQLNSLKKQLAASSKQARGSEQRVAAIAAELAVSAASQETTSRKLATEASLRRRAEKELKALQVEKEAGDAAVKELSAKLDAETELVKSLRGEVEALSSELQGTQKEMEKRLAAASAQHEQQQAAAHEALSLHTEMKAVRDKVVLMEERLQEEVASREAAEEGRRAAEEEKDATTAKLRELKEEIRAVLACRDALQAEHDAYKTKVQEESKALLAQHTDEVGALRDEAKVEKDLLAARHRDEVESLRSELKELQTVWEEQYRELSATHQGLTDEAHQLRGEVERLRVQLQEVEDELTASRTHLSEAEAKVAAKAEEIAILEDAAVLQRKALGEVEETKRALAESLSRVKAEHRSTSSPSSSLPVFPRVLLLGPAVRGAVQKIAAAQAAFSGTYEWNGCCLAGRPVYYCPETDKALRMAMEGWTLVAPPVGRGGKQFRVWAPALKLDDESTYDATWTDGEIRDLGVRVRCHGTIDGDTLLSARVQELRGYATGHECSWEEWEMLVGQWEEALAKQANNTQRAPPAADRTLKVVHEARSADQSHCEKLQRCIDETTSVLDQEGMLQRPTALSDVQDLPSLPLSERVRRSLLRAYDAGASDATLPLDLRDDPQLTVEDRFHRALQRIDLEVAQSGDVALAEQFEAYADDDTLPLTDRFKLALHREALAKNVRGKDSPGPAPDRPTLPDDDVVPRKIQDGSSLPAAERLARAFRRELWRVQQHVPPTAQDAPKARLQARVAAAFAREAWLAKLLEAKQPPVPGKHMVRKAVPPTNQQPPKPRARTPASRK